MTDYMHTLDVPGSAAVPTADGTSNATLADILGNKSDAAVASVGTTASLEAYLKGQLGLMVGVPKILRKTITFTGAAGAGAVGQVTVATPTGLVLVKRIIPVCTVDLTGALATLSLGHAAVVNALIAATLGTTIDAGQYWLSASPAALLLALPALLQTFVLATPITLDVLVAGVTGGVLVFDIEYMPLNGGSLA